MEFSLENRTARLSVGELAGFYIGPREAGEGAQGLWRAQLGTRWHQELRTQVAAEIPHAMFEVTIAGAVVHRGWTISLLGRIDQLIPPSSQDVNPNRGVLREIKTVLREIPTSEDELRADYPEYFAQLATYLALSRFAAPIHPLLSPTTSVAGELMFVEAGSGLAQTIALNPADEQLFWAQLERLTEFLNLRQRARERLRNLRYNPAFGTPREGQEKAQTELLQNLRERPVVFFEAPTGFGKTGAMLESALTLLRDGEVDRVIYLTSKATGQLQVSRQLANMTAVGSPGGGEPHAGTTVGLAAWHVRNKREHCVNTAYQCVRDACRFLHDVPARWKAHGLSRFYLNEAENRSIDSLREAGKSAGVCPYEITRTALAFNDVWVGDYNYVFAPSTRGLFADQPGFDPSRTLLIIDEAHNLPSRVADSYSHTFGAADAALVVEALHRIRAFAPLVNAWEHWAHFLSQIRPCEVLDLASEDDARHLMENVAKHVGSVPLDFLELGNAVTELIWSIPAVLAQWEINLPRLWWSARQGDLQVTCLDAANAIGPTIRGYKRALLASATLSPVDEFAAACGLDAPASPAATAVAPDKLGKLNKRMTKKLFAQLSTGKDLLIAEEEKQVKQPAHLLADAPWRHGAYDVALDLRVDTSYQQRSKHFATTAQTISDLSDAAARDRQRSASQELTSCVAVFFSSYSYAESIKTQLENIAPGVRVSVQPRLPDLASQNRWMEEALILSDAMFLVLGSSFAEGVDLLGGRVAWSMVVGPALPEVNAVQRARSAAFSGLSREAAFRRVYQIPGIQKVNQGLGRLVRAPGHRAKVLLHCRRFADPAYASLLVPEYQFGKHITSDDALADWLGTGINV